MQQENEKETNKFVQIYLFDPKGNFYWCNGSADVDIENQGVLHAGLFATLFNFSKETLGEKLNYLLINELRINMFSILNKYLVAVVTPSFLRIDTGQIENIKIKISRVLNQNKKNIEDNIIDTITVNLNMFLDELLDWLDKYVSQANRAMNIFTSEMNKIEKKEVGVFLYTWDWNRVFKYIPSNNMIEYQVEEFIDNSISNIDFVSNLNRTFLIRNNTIIYFIVSDVILIMTKSFKIGDLDSKMSDLINSANYFEGIINQIEGNSEDPN